MEGLQLLPETKRKIGLYSPGENKTMFRGFLVCVAVAVVSLGLMVYRYSLEKKLADIAARLTEQEKGRDKDKEKELLTFASQASQITAIFANHIFWSQAFPKIAAVIEPQVQVKSFDADAGQNKIQIRAEASGYAMVAKQLAAVLSQSPVTDASVSEIKTLNNGHVAFSLNIEFKKPGFLTSK